MKMIIADFQEYVGTLATKYSDFEFKIDIKGGSFSSVADPAADRIDTTYTEKGEGTILIESGPFNEWKSGEPMPKDGEESHTLDNILAEIKSKVANLGIENYDQIEYDCGPYVWFTIRFTAEGRDVVSNFPLDRLDEFVESVNSVIDQYR